MANDAARLMQMTVMLEMQDDMNRRVDENWLECSREWYRAIWIECAELMDHYGGWKWWKHGEPDIEQSMLEIVDIWHFGLSMQLDHKRNYEGIASQILDLWQAPKPIDNFLHGVELLAESALAERAFDVAVVPSLLTHLGRDFDALYCAYVGKNVLNFFRQDHGYKEGTYVKTWGAKEDNEHLAEILAQLDTRAANFKTQVYATLAARYPA